jgi:hypothetical protein
LRQPTPGPDQEMIFLGQTMETAQCYFTRWYL